MATLASPGGRRHHHGGRPGEARHSASHRLSSKAAEHEGWADGISALTEEHTATQLLEEGRAPAGSAPAAAAAKVRCRAWGAGPVRSEQAWHGRRACSLGALHAAAPSLPHTGPPLRAAAAPLPPGRPRPRRWRRRAVPPPPRRG